MIFSKSQNFPIPFTTDGKILQRASRFKHLGFWIEQNMNPDIDIRDRIAQARQSFLRYRHRFCDPYLDSSLRLRFMNYYVSSVLLYGVETRNLKVGIMNNIESFESGAAYQCWGFHGQRESVTNRYWEEQGANDNFSILWKYLGPCSQKQVVWNTLANYWRKPRRKLNFDQNIIEDLH